MAITEQQKATNHRCYAKNVDARRLYARERKRKEREAGNVRTRPKEHPNWESYKERQRNKNILLRAHVIERYGNKCMCCGETCLDFLDIDHVNNDGKEHRRSITSGGISICRWAVRNGYPDSLQVLCSNCNQGKRRNGGICPHKRLSERSAFNDSTAKLLAEAALNKFLNAVELGIDSRYGIPGVVTPQAWRGLKDISQ